jgi:hypothetical protein
LPFLLLAQGDAPADLGKPGPRRGQPCLQPKPLFRSSPSRTDSLVSVFPYSYQRLNME